MQILLVDDHAEVRQMLRVALGRHPGLDIVGEAASAGAAAGAAGISHPDVIVLDLLLPDAEPREVLAQVHEASPASRIVVFSARESCREWYQQRCARFFGKLIDDLDAVVDWFLTEERRAPRHQR